MLPRDEGGGIGGEVGMADMDHLARVFGLLDSFSDSQPSRSRLVKLVPAS